MVIYSRNISRHLKECGNLQELEEILCEIRWVLRRINQGGWSELNNDFSILLEISEEAGMEKILFLLRTN